MAGQVSLPAECAQAANHYALSPQSGPASGRTWITITGEGFAVATGVSFGGIPAAFSIKSDSKIVAMTPPASSAAGTADVLASLPGRAAKFAYNTSGEVYLPGSGWSTMPELPRAE